MPHEFPRHIPDMLSDLTSKYRLNPMCKATGFASTFGLKICELLLQHRDICPPLRIALRYGIPDEGLGTRGLLTSKAILLLQTLHIGGVEFTRLGFLLLCLRNQCLVSSLRIDQWLPRHCLGIPALRLGERRPKPRIGEEGLLCLG